MEFKLNFKEYYNNSDYHSLYSFTEQTSLFMGLCLLPQCNEFYDLFFNRQLNKKFYESLPEFSIKNMKAYTEEVTSFQHVTFIVLFWVILAYILIRITISIIGYFLYSKYNLEKTDPNQSDYSSSVSYDDSNSNIFEEGNKPQEAYKKTKFFKVFKLLSIKYSMKYIYKIKNNYYDDKGVELLSFLRFWILFWITFNHSVFSLTKIPHRDFGNYSFYLTYYFFLVKYSIYAIDCFVFLDGMYFAYKLMGHLHSRKSYSFATFMKFYFNFGSKLVLFFVVLFMYQLYVDDFGMILGRGGLFDFFMDNFIKNRACNADPSIIFIPFYMQYCTDEVTIGSICYRATFLYMNEFFCITIFTLIFYISYKLRFWIFDTIVFLGTMTSMFISHMYYDDIVEGVTQYTLRHVMGEGYGLIKFHLFVGTFFLGLNAGLIFFYYNNIVSNQPIDPDVDYIPFYYDYMIMRFLDARSKIFKISIISLTILCQLAISFSFNIFLAVYGEKENDLKIIFNPFLKQFYIYERRIFTIIYLIFLITLLFYPKITTLKYILTSKIFIPFNRISFAYMLILSSFIYLVYSMYDIQIYMNYRNIFFINISLIILIYIGALSNAILFEVPIRIIWKNVLRIGETKKIKNKST